MINQRSNIKIIRNNENRGFAAGQNQGIKESVGKYVMSMNFDIHLKTDYLERSIAIIDAYSSVGSVSGKMLRMLPDGTHTDTIDNTGLLLSRRRMPDHRGAGEMDVGQYEISDLVFGVMGSAALHCREMMEDIAYQGQYYDESFFTWYEDIDLDWRARLRGWDCVYIPQAVAYHIGDPHGHQKRDFAYQITIFNRWQMILANECRHCFRKNAYLLLSEEVSLLRHIVLTGKIVPYLKAMLNFLQSIPAIMKKRHYVRSHINRRCLPDYPLPLSMIGEN